VSHADGTQVGQITSQSHDSRNAIISPMEIWSRQPKERPNCKVVQACSQARAADAYWDPAKECIKNTSNKMLTVAMADDDNLYRAAEKSPLDLALPKRKWVQLEEESLDNTISMIKSIMSTKKTCKSALKTTNTKDGKKAKTSITDSPTIASQATLISHQTSK